jgi:hypothetical protein
MGGLEARLSSLHSLQNLTLEYVRNRTLGRLSLLPLSALPALQPLIVQRCDLPSPMFLSQIKYRKRDPPSSGLW